MFHVSQSDLMRGDGAADGVSQGGRGAEAGARGPRPRPRQAGAVLVLGVVVPEKRLRVHASKIIKLRIFCDTLSIFGDNYFFSLCPQVFLSNDHKMITMTGKSFHGKIRSACHYLHLFCGF